MGGEMMKKRLGGLVLVLFITVLVAPPLLLSQENDTPDTAAPEVAEEADLNESELPVFDDETEALPLQSELTGFSIWDFLRMVLVLAAVIVVIYGLFIFLKRIGNPKTGDTGLIEVLASQPLSGSRSLHLVQVVNEVYLIGSADGTVSLVSKLEDKETLDRIALHESGRKAPGGSFAGTFRSMFGDPAREQDEAVGSLFLRKQRERLKKL
jgi:flagellar protein FliO/FliZ